MSVLDLKEFKNISAWPFQEAVKLVERFGNKIPDKGHVLFATGYGPSGLPHIGTFGEIVRTTMVRQAFNHLCKIPTKLFAFSDDMDALRKVPDNIPNQSMLKEHLGKSLSTIPDPFGKFNSFGEHNNALLRSFLDRFGFEYEFKSATELYKSGVFDNALLNILGNYEKIRNIILPTLGNERKETYSPFLPICPSTGKVLQVKVVNVDLKSGSISYIDEQSGDEVNSLVTGGKCKLQWKADWAMRWFALGVDYEMLGKDLIDSLKLSSKICGTIGGIPPQTFIYELFLDENGEKISKSKGNGLSLEEWLRYAPRESLSLYMYKNPQRAKRLYFDIIPKSVDEYADHLEKFNATKGKEDLENPVWHIHNGLPPKSKIGINFSMLLNLVSVCHTEDRNVLLGFINRYLPNLPKEKDTIITQLLDCAIAYYQDFVKPNKRFKEPNEKEKKALTELEKKLTTLKEGTEAEEIQTIVYDVGKSHFDDLRGWFKSIYQILFGQEAGPRMGSFIVLYGIQETCELINSALKRKN